MNPSGQVVEQLRAQGWSPDGVATDFAVLPTTWAGAAASLRERLLEARPHGVLLTGVCSGATTFRVEMRARNRASTSAADADGRRRSAERISRLGPAVLRATAPVQPMLAAVRAAGLPVEPSSDAGDYLCNFTLYGLLAAQSGERDALPVAFLHLPPTAGEAGPGFTLDDLKLGVTAAAGALAGALGYYAREPVDA